MRWPKEIGSARAVQEKLKKRVKITPLREVPAFIAGVDASFTDDRIIASVCLYTYPTMELVGNVFEEKEIIFPYIPGFLAFREGPAIVAALKKLKLEPDIILVDGQGIAHPQGIGVASHLGVILDTPSIGCAKSRLVGEYLEPGNMKGDWSCLWYNGETVGAVVRTRSNVRPLFVSPGHRIDLDDSITIVLNCTRKYRIPEPLRSAHILSRKLKREHQKP